MKVLKPMEELKQEARTVQSLLQQANPMPMEAGELYYVVSMEWYLQWKHFTDYSNSIDGDTPMGTSTTDNGVEAKVVGTPGTIEAHPGVINNKEQIEKLQIENEPWLKHISDTVQLKLSCKEDQDFVLLPEAVWKVLHEIYGGCEILRKSIEAACDEDTQDKTYIVEVYYQKL